MSRDMKDMTDATAWAIAALYAGFIVFGILLLVVT